ncbi:MAG: TIGR01458 family HAD-type hydrolase [Deltaproteobacteria bacterium]|nr:TIGR01458 family HAD-type hydrolase [Deltaproteobacteria bacterium]
MIRAVLLDLEGTLHIGDRAVPGAAQALRELRDRGLPCRFVTNVTTRCAESLHDKLIGLGMPIERGEILSAPQAAVRYLRKMGSPRCLLLLAEDTLRDFAEFPRSDKEPEVIVVGDIGNRWDGDLMQRLFAMILGGAQLVTLHKGRYWEAGDGLRIDIGAFIAALEYASGRQATVIGKPSPRFYELAIESMGVPAAEIAMVGDDLDTDVAAAQSLGLKGVLVKTGKYRPELAARSEVHPDAVLESIRDLPGWLGATV